MIWTHISPLLSTGRYPSYIVVAKTRQDKLAANITSDREEIPSTVLLEVTFITNARNPRVWKHEPTKYTKENPPSPRVQLGRQQKSYIVNTRMATAV